MAEPWRVVLASGEVREVVARWPVARHGIPRWGAQHREDEHTGHGSTARGAVVDCAAVYVWEVVEILAPGEMTRAELAAQLAAVTAERDALAPLVTEARRVLFWAEAVVDAWGIASSDGDGPNVDEVDAAIRTLADEAGDWTLAGPHTTHDALAKACDDAREERDDARAERNALRLERDGEHDLIARQFAILTAVADALKGTPPALRTHSHHDLGAVAAATVAQQAPLVACVDALRAAARDAGWRDADATGESLVAWVRRGEREACAAACERIERGAAEALDDVGFDSARVYIGRRDAAGDCARVIRGREGGE